jgi:hypothetical protein
MAGARDRRGPDGEAGAATVETTGVVIIAALLVLTVLVAAVPQARNLGATYSYWVCQVVTFGQGGCTPPPTSPESHEPTEPCVLTQDGMERNQEISVVVVTASDGRRIEIQQLSNGEYRITVSDSNGAGAEVGVGGGLTVTVNDNTVGGSATADAGASLDIRTGDVYYTDDDGLQNLMNALLEDQVKDAVVGENGPVRWLTDGVGNLVGVGNDLPEADEVYAEGGFSLNASAEATGLTQSGNASVSVAQLLGTRTNRDGTVTVYLQSSVEGEAGLQELGFDTEGEFGYQGASLEGSAEVVTAVTFDPQGNMTQVSATATTAGSSSGIAAAMFGGDVDTSMSNSTSGLTIYQSTLNTDNDADRDIAGAYLLTQGVASLGGWVNPVIGAAGTVASIEPTLNFFEAAAHHGTVTQQTYDTDSNTVFGIDATGKLGIELGVSANVSTDSMVSTDAQYWDGTQWVEWEDCA